MHRTQPRGSSLARQGMSDLAIRNWFIIPTIVFLIVFNIFPLLYSLGF
jgi:multiple sugar transport system permease protein